MACTPITKLFYLSPAVCTSPTADGSKLKSLVNVSELLSQISSHSILSWFFSTSESIQVKVTSDLIVVAFLEQLLHYPTDYSLLESLLCPLLISLFWWLFPGIFLIIPHSSVLSLVPSSTGLLILPLVFTLEKYIVSWTILYIVLGAF